MAKLRNGVARTLSAYICTPDRKIVCRIKGITSFEVAGKGLNDFSTINFVVQKYTTNQATLQNELNESYAKLHAFCEIFIPEYDDRGAYFLINAEPEIIAQGERNEYKQFTAASYESVLQYENLVNFKINQGTEESVEMEPDNLDELGIPKKLIRLWDEDPKFSLIDLVLRDDYYGWRPGEIDPAIKTLERSFDVQTQNIYSFLCGDVPKAFRCVVTFDTVGKLINIHSIENFGTNTNIYLSLSHFLSQISISPRSEDIYTVFNVAGDNELDISRVNFGSNKIVNIDYPLSLLDEEIQQAYADYVVERNSYRERYADDAKNHSAVQAKIDSINDRQPMDIIYNNWASTTYYPDDDLANYLAVYQAAVTAIEGLYKSGPDEPVDMNALNASPDAAMYHSYKDVAIPDIQAEIAARAQDPPSHNRDPVNPDFIYEMWGLNDLEVRQITFQDRIRTLEEAGYAANQWDPASSISEATWIEHHAEYLEYVQHYNSLDAVMERKRGEIAALQQELAAYQSDMLYTANRASLDGYSGFTDEQRRVIKSLYRESDYQDSNYGITDIDDPVSISAKSQELFDAATSRLEVESAPQFTWTVSSANLYAMREFELLRDELNVGDFITLGFNTYGIAPIIVRESEYKPGGIRFRVTEIDYSGIDKGGTFNITFSDMVQTRTYRDDFETLLESFVSSQTNQIQAGTVSTASTIAAQVTASIIKPYIEAQNAKLDNALISQATIQDLTATNARVETLIADYIETEEFAAKVAEVVHLDVFDLEAAHITADEEITLVSDDSGSITIANSTMQFRDANGDVRVQIGLDANKDYNLEVFSPADSQGNQKLLWGTNGVTSNAIADHLIVNDMMNWNGISEGTDHDGKPYWDSSKIAVDGGRLDNKWNELKTEVASIEIIASSQVIEDDGSVTLTPVLHLLDSLDNVVWSYRAPTEVNWTTVGSVAATTDPYVRNDHTVVVPGTATKFTDDNNSLIFKASYISNSAETHFDILTVFKLPEGSEGYAVVLSNEAQTIATTPDLHPEAETYICNVSVYRGRTPMTPVMESIPGVDCFYVNGVCDEQAVSLSFQNPGECRWTFDSTKIVPKNFQIELRITINGFESVVKRYISLSAAVAGESPVIVEIDSSAGNIFKSGNISSTLTARVTRGSEDITQQCTKFIWTKYDKNGDIDETWTRETLTPVTSITTKDVQNKSIFRCEVEY